MKKNQTWFLMLAVLSSLFFLSSFLYGAKERKSDETEKKVAEVYRQALKLNRGRFADVNLILVGDTVFLPERGNGGIEPWIAQKSSQGKHDSFCRLSEKYIDSQVVSRPKEIVKAQVPKPEKIEVAIPAEENPLAWLVWLGLSLIVIVFIWLFQRGAKALKRLAK